MLIDPQNSILGVELEARLHSIRARLSRAALAAGRSAESVTLVAVSKGQGEAAVRTLAALGDRTSMVRLMIRYADDDLVPLCDRRSIRWYFDERPPLGARIAAITGHADPCPGGGGPKPTAAEVVRP